MSKDRICFIIAHKYYRGYESYLKYYIDNIQTLYPHALTIVVDNNSKYVDDIFDPLRGCDNVVLLENDIECKFELGAYQVGIRYIINNNLLEQYTHYVCVQDTFVLKNYYDFDNNMTMQNCYARPINSMYADGACADVFESVLKKIGLYDHLDKINFCWCSSFVVASHKIEQLYNYLKQIIQKVRWESEGAERYLARILWELNEHRDCGDIDGSAADLHVRHYDTWRVNIYSNSTSHFVKKVQQKNENTIDKDAPQRIVHIPSSVNKANYDRKR